MSTATATRKRSLRRSPNGELPEVVQLIPGGEDLSYNECVRRSHKVVSDAEARDEVAFWASQDPKYAAIVSSLLDELHGREQGQPCDHQPYRKVSHAKPTHTNHA